MPALPTSERPGSISDARDGVERLLHAPDLDVDVVLDRGGLVLGRVGDPEAAADVQQPAVEVDEVGQQLDRLHVGLQLEDLGADVGVHTDQVQVARRLHAPHRLGREPVLEAEAELRVDLAGLDVAVGGRLDSGRDPDQDLLRAVEQALGELDLGERVEHQIADARRRTRAAARPRSCCSRA